MENILEEKWNRLLDPNHLDHEEIIRYLQDHPDPGSVPYINEAIRLKPGLEYLEYDDYGAYYKKCLWVLQEIGTPEAVRLIRKCSVSDIPELKAEAIYRLSKPPLSELL